jgi:hypothetical protein
MRRLLISLKKDTYAVALGKQTLKRRKITKLDTVVISNRKERNPYAYKTAYPNETIAESEVINTYEMLHTTNPTRHFGNLKAKIVLVMLSNFIKTEDELTTDTDRWLYALKDLTLTSSKLKISMFKEISDISKVAYGSHSLEQFYAQLYTESIQEDILF